MYYILAKEMIFFFLRERWVFLKIPRCDIDGLGEEQ